MRMTTARCFGEAMKIAAHNRRKWPELLEKVRTICPHQDCSATDCQEVCKQWLRMQWRIQVAKEVKR